MTKQKRTTAIAFAILLLLWIFMVLHGTLGFEPPRNTEAILHDCFHALIWAAFLYSAWKLYQVWFKRTA